MVTNSRVKPMLIGAIAKQSGVNTETIRYYEREGLLPTPPRSLGRQRLYDATHVQRLSFIRRGRELGFPLDSIRALLALVDDGASSCCATKEIALRHLTEVDGKIKSLQRLKRALKAMTDACQPGNQISCPIIDALNTPAEVRIN